MVLVTGASGFLGAYVVCALLDKGETVIAIKRTSSNMSEFNDIYLQYKFNIKPSNRSLKWVDGDILDINFLDDIFQKIDYVFHCAALVSFNRSDIKSLHQTNAEGTANIVNACLKANIRKLIYVSSTAAIGRTDEAKIIEETTPWSEDDNNTLYAQSKHNGELEVWRGIEEGLHAVIVNPSIILGYGSWHKGSSTLFKKINDGLLFYTEGENAFIGVGDVAFIMVKLAFSDIVNERFILISENRTYKSIFNNMAQSMNKTPPSFEVKKSYLWIIKLLMPVYLLFKSSSTLTFETLKTSMMKNRYCNQKIKKVLNYEFEPIHEVIEKAAQLYLK